MQPVNIDVSALDMYLVWNRPIAHWTPSVTLGMHKQWLNMEATDTTAPSYRIISTIPSRCHRAFSSHSTPTDRPLATCTNRFGASWFTLNASVSKVAFQQIPAAEASATDILNTRNNDWTMNTYGIYVNKRQTYDSRGITISLTYRFHPRKANTKARMPPRPR